MNNNKVLEKSTPSPLVYNNLKAWNVTNKSHRVSGTIKTNEQRTTFVLEQEFLANDVPAAKYSIVSPVSIIILTFIG